VTAELSLRRWGTDMTWTMEQFIAALQRLAMPAEPQLASLPDGCCKGDELALDFDNFRRCAGVVIPSEAIPLVEQLDEMLGAMSGEANAELWTDDAIRQCREWERVRAKAQEILKSMKQEPPQAGGTLRR